MGRFIWHWCELVRDASCIIASHHVSACPNHIKVGNSDPGHCRCTNSSPFRKSFPSCQYPTIPRKSENEMPPCIPGTSSRDDISKIALGTFVSPGLPACVVGRWNPAWMQRTWRTIRGGARTLPGSMLTLNVVCIVTLYGTLQMSAYLPDAHVKSRFGMVLHITIVSTIFR